MADLFGNETPAGYAQVALERGIDVGATGLTYAVPDELGDLAVGERVVVPLGRGNKPVTGYVIELRDTTEIKQGLKRIVSRDAKHVSLPADLIELARWIAGYYCCPLGMVFASMLPAAVARGTGSVTRTMVRLAGGPQSPDPKVSKLQQAVLNAAAQHTSDWIEIKHLADLAGAKSTSPVKQLIDKGLLKTKRAEQVVSDLDLRAQREAEPVQAFTLNASQSNALDHLIAHVDSGFGVHLLHGVTGSGKTEVYLRLIERILQSRGVPPRSAPTRGGSDEGVIVLVPEISLTPQTVARFLARFDAESVAVLHSGLTAAQRHVQWRRIRDGQARIVVGARSAIFAPLPRLGLVIVDEEHESSYKQDQLPRYHARDVAVKRAQLAGIPVVLGSATPSLESYYNATTGVQGSGFRDRDSATRTPNPEPRTSKYHLITMPDRVAGMKLPAVEIVDLQQERRQRRGVHLISRRLQHEIGRTIDERKQTMLLLNRRGFANYIACPDHRCGWLMTCDYCDVTTVYHKDDRLPTGGLVLCHHCGAENLLPATCPVCAKKITVFGLGTQRVEEELGRKFPRVRAARMDSDAMRSGRDYADTLDAFRRGDIDVLLGTQMIAKGLDFPGVRLVGVISADTSLHLPDFRSGERTFQLIAQVAGRAGRSEQPGRVIVQSFNPADPVIGLAAQHDYEGFARREIVLREKVGLPPVTRMARIVVRDRKHLACYERAKTLADHLAAFNEKLKAHVRLRGPAACPIARIGGFHRQQIELIAADAAALQKLMTALRNTKLLISDAKTAVDVDPVALL